MNGHVWKTAAAAACLALALPSFGAVAEDWSLSEDGKYWMYYYAPGEPAVDEWIQYGGNEYYLDRSGHMKTGWITDPDTEERVYLGPDGAKSANLFAEDGKYVGSDSREVKAFNKYLKAAKKEAEGWFSQIKKTGGETMWLCSEDLDGDGYRDLAVSQGDAGGRGRLLGVYVWDSGGQELNVSFEADLADARTTARLFREKDDGELWLELLEGDSGCSYFSLGDAGPVFENEFNYTMEVDDWGTILYLENEEEISRDEWAQSRQRTRARLEEADLSFSLVTGKAGIEDALNRGLTAQESLLWEE